MTRNANRILDGCLIALERCVAVVDALSDDRYMAAPAGHSSVGEHMRHCLDHYTCFLRGIEEGVIDYDARDRDVALEGSRQAARSSISRFRSGIESMRSRDLGAPIEVRQCPSSDGEPVTAASSIDRELIFLSSHTIHHIAIMCLIAEKVGADLSNVSTLAFSTEAYRAAQSRDA